MTASETPLGIRLDEAVAVAVDGSAVYVAGFINGALSADYFVIKYDATGNITWVARYPIPTDSDPQIAIAAALDGSGIYVTGYAVQNSINRIVTVKFAK
jgi:hypothetical protein